MGILAFAVMFIYSFAIVPSKALNMDIVDSGFGMAGERWETCFETQTLGNFCIPIDHNNISSVGRQQLTNCLGNVSSYTGNNCSAINLSFSTNNAAPTGSEATCPSAAATNGFNSSMGSTITTASTNLTVSGIKWTATGSVTICTECLQFYNGTLFASSNFTCVPMLTGDNASLSHSVYINGT